MMQKRPGIMGSPRNESRKLLMTRNKKNLSQKQQTRNSARLHSNLHLPLPCLNVASVPGKNPLALWIWIYRNERNKMKFMLQSTLLLLPKSLGARRGDERSKEPVKNDKQWGEQSTGGFSQADNKTLSIIAICKTAVNNEWKISPWRMN